MIEDRSSYRTVGREYKEVRKLQDQFVNEDNPLLEHFAIGVGFLHDDGRKERSFGVRFFNYKPLTRRSVTYLTASLIGRIPEDVGTFIEYIGTVSASGSGADFAPKVWVLKRPNFEKAA